MKSLQKALAILEAVSRADVPPRITEIALQVGIPRPTAHRVIQTLIGGGYLTQDSQSNRLTIGFSALVLSASVLDRNRLRIEALPHLQDLANIAGTRANLGILHRNQVLYLAGVEKPALPTIYTRFGRSAPAHCSSLGKAILAYLPEVELQRLLAAQPLVAYTPASITSITRLMEELEKVRREGFAVDHEEHIPGSSCVATAILDAQKRPLASIGLSDRSLDVLLAHVPSLKHKAEIIAHVL